MKNISYIILFIASLLNSNAIAQNATQAQKDFDAGNYAKALPIYRTLVKKSPSNPAYNFYYGACCYETGSLTESVTYLEKSAKRNYINAFRYLGKVYFDLYNFDEAIDSYEQHIELLRDKKRDTEKAEEELNFIRKVSLMYKSVEDIAVIDSFIISKNDFLNAYKISKESGTLKQESNSVIYETEMGDKKIYSQPNEEGTFQLYTQNKLIDNWSAPTPISSLNDMNNVNYPFLMGDGITLYFASDTEGSIGGYDIFVTRYNSEDDTYLRPNNIGMPFNSFANDYMLAIDEFNNLGWFASDRYQPTDTICIYIFVPNESKVTLDYDTTDPNVLRNAATLRSIKDTWRDENKVRLAKQRLMALFYTKETEQKKGDFEFIIDDTATYTSLNDFHSKDARNLYLQILQKQKDYLSLNQELESKRTKYERGNTGEKNQLTESILDLEKRAKQLYSEINELTEKVRNTEISQNKH